MPQVRHSPPRYLPWLFVLLGLFCPLQADEAAGLPNLLQFDSGAPVRTKEEWQARRKELRRLLEEQAVGHPPPGPRSVRGVVEKEQNLCNGRVTYRLVTLIMEEPRVSGFKVALFLPAEARSALPVLIHPSFEATPGAEPLAVLPRPPGQGKGVDALQPVDPLPAAIPGPSTLKPRDPEAVAGELLALLSRGYGVLTYHYQDTGEDTTLRLPDGGWAFRTTRFFPAYPGFDWGLLGAWAWGVSRCVDYLDTQDWALKDRHAVLGHSRIGKAALVAGAFDKRLAVTLAAGSGAGGTQAYRLCGPGRGDREGLDVELRKYPNWFAPGLRGFLGRGGELPYDQHAFLALIAPRALLSLEGTDDHNCTPAALRGAMDAAAPVFLLTGAPPWSLSAHYAPHAHGLHPSDWEAAADFLDLQLRGVDRGRSWNQFP